MKKRSLLQEMRARRDAQEETLAAPHREAAARAQQVARVEREARAGLERLLASPLAKEIMKEHAYSISRELHRMISKTVYEAMGKDPSADSFTVSLPKSVLMFQDPSSIASKITDLYVNGSRRDGSGLLVSTSIEPVSMGMRVNVALPSLHNEIAVDRAHFF